MQTDQRKSEAKQRLHDIAIAMKMSDRAWCLTCGLRPDQINKTGETLSSDVVGKIFHTYPELNLEYILWGDGEMFSASLNDAENENVNRMVYSIFKEQRARIEELVADNAVLKARLTGQLVQELDDLKLGEK